MRSLERELNSGEFVVVVAGEDVNITTAADAAHHTRIVPQLQVVDHRAAHLHLGLELPGDAELGEGPVLPNHHVVVVEPDGLDLMLPGGEGGGDGGGGGTSASHQPVAGERHGGDVAAEVGPGSPSEGPERRRTSRTASPPLC